MKKNVKEVYETGLCLACGLCASLCPDKNVEINLDRWGNYSIKVSDKCLDCGLCLKCCPGTGVDFDLLNQETFGEIPKDPYLGNFLTTHIGRALDPVVRHTGASGGIITTLGSYLLSNKQVEGVCVVRPSQIDPLAPEVFVARNPAEMLSAAQSKYYPIPMNIELRRMLESDERFAAVGKPCDIHGIRKAAQYLPKIRERVIYSLGIMCMWSGSRQGILNWLYIHGVKDCRKVSSIRFREGDWPGKRVALLKEGGQLSPSTIEAFVTPFIFFCPKRCTLCPDQTNELSDIAVGDAWVSDINQYRGTAVIIGRSEKGVRILLEAQKAGLLDLQEVPPEKVMESQGYMLHYKKISWKARMEKYSIDKIPSFKMSHLPNAAPSLSDKLAALVWHFTQKISRSVLGFKTIKYLPNWSYEWFTKALFKGITGQSIFRGFKKTDFLLTSRIRKGCQGIKQGLI